MLWIPALLVSLSITWAGNPCVPRDFGHSSHVCVCTKEYCDEYDPVEPPSSSGEIYQYVSDRPEGRRLEKYTLTWSNDSATVGAVINIDPSVKFQKNIRIRGSLHRCSWDQHCKVVR